MSADRKPGMDRRQFLKLAATGALALGGAGLGILAQPGTAAAAGKPAEASQAAPGQAVVSVGFPDTIDLKFKVPSSFAPEGDASSVKNVLIPKGPGVAVTEGVLWHPKTDRDGVWAYDQSIAIKSNPGIVVRSHAGVEGQLAFRQGLEVQDTALVVATLASYKDSQGKVTDFAGYPDSFQLDTHCETDMWIFDPATGKLVEVGGKPLKGTTSGGGDILFKIASAAEGRREGWIGVAYRIPVDTGNETDFEKAYRDSSYKINEMNLRAHLTKAW